MLLACRYKNAYYTPYSLLWVRRLLFRRTTLVRIHHDQKRNLIFILIFGLQNVQDARLRGYVLAYFLRSFLGGVVAQLLLLPLWGRRDGVWGDRIVLREWLLFLGLVAVHASPRS